MDDEELILRYLTLSESYDVASGEVRNYTGKMKGTLNKFMDSNRKADQAAIGIYETRFVATIEKVFAVFGPNAFRKINEDGSVENRPNRAIMDCVMISFQSREKHALEAKKEAIVALLQRLPQEDAAFNSAITISTSDKKQLEYRLGVWNRSLEQVLKGASGNGQL
jgi:hypothetical protein